MRRCGSCFGPCLVLAPKLMLTDGMRGRCTNHAVGPFEGLLCCSCVDSGLLWCMLSAWAMIRMANSLTRALPEIMLLEKLKREK